MDGDPDEQWIVQRIHRRRQEGQDVWVRVRIQTSSWGLILSTPNAPSIGYGGGGLNGEQQRVAELWNLRVREPVEPGALIAFLKQLRQLL